jgi:sugar lactone lactonase YvrE
MVIRAGRSKSTFGFLILATALSISAPAATLAPSSSIVGPAAGSGTATLTQSPAAAWTAVSSATWLTVAPGSGSGTATLTFTFTANSGANARQAAIRVAGQVFPVLQLGATGAYTAWGSTAYGQIRTIAGNGTSGYSGDGAAATLASLSGPIGIAVDANGNVYIADYGNDRIRRVSGASGTITLFAGTGTSGSAGDSGPATSAQLSNPVGLALDGAGNLYLADLSNNRIRRIDGVTGTITTVAGTGVYGFGGDGGAATSAQLSQPRGVALDSAGNLYVADTSNNRIRRIDAVTGLITTVAGAGAAGFVGDGGPATSAELYQPYGVALDRAGNLYIADSENSRIRRVDAVTAEITTVAGGGAGGDGALANAASLNTPQNIVLDPRGNLYIADYFNRNIRRVDSLTGIITTVAGTGGYGYGGDDGPATLALLSYPAGVALDGAGNLYVADTNNNRIRFVDQTTPQVTLGAGVGVGLAAGTGSVGITVLPAGAVWQATSNAAWLTITTPTGAGSGTIGFSFVANGSAISRSASISVYGRTVNVTQAGAAVALSGTSATAGSSAGTGSFSVTVTPAATWTASSSASWLTVSPASGSASGTVTYNYSANSGASARTGVITIAGKSFAVLQLGTSGAYTAWGSTGYGQIRTIAGNGTLGSGGDGGAAILASLAYPGAVAVDAAGNVYIADSNNSRIRRVDAVTGVITTVAGGGSSGDNGPAISASLNGPQGVAVDANGNLYIADSYNGKIRRVDAITGTITTVAGSAAAGFSGDGGPATSAQLNQPNGVAVDANGNLYVADSNNSRIRRVDAITGVITTLAGSGISGFSGDGGAASSAQISGPTGVAVDNTGNVFVVDQGNQRIRRVDGISGKMTTVAGVGCCGFSGDGGPATAAILYYPHGVAVDLVGNIYIADSYNQRIRRVDSNTGIITTVVGSGVSGYGGDGGPATAALLNDPTGLAIDGAGNLYVADSNNYRVRFVDLATPQVTLASAAASVGAAAGSGSVGITVVPASALWQAASSASWLTLTSTSGAGSGTLNYSFSANNSISTRKATITVYGQTLTVTQSGSVVALSATSAIVGAAADSGSVTLTVTPAASWTAASTAAWLTVSPASGSFGGTLTYNYIANTSVNARGATLTIAGTAFSVLQLGVSGAYTAWGSSVYGNIKTIAGTGSSGYSGDGGAAIAAAVGPNGVAVDANGDVYIADTNNNRIRRVDSTSGVITTVAGNGTFSFADNAVATSGSLASPRAVALDAAGDLYIADTSNNRIRRVDAVTGALTTVAGNGSAGVNGDGGPATAAGLNNPSGVALDGTGNLFIADTGNYRIRRVDAVTGVISTIAGSGASGFSGDGGLAAAALLTSPSAVTADAAGNLYIADNQRIRRVDALSGLISTVAGTGVGGFSGDGGLATAAELYGPAGLALDAQGDLFIDDSSNSRVRRVDAGTGVITTVVGTGNCCSALGDGGPALAAQLQDPLGLALDANGNLYIGDTNRVRFVDYSTARGTLSPSVANVASTAGSGTAAVTVTPAGASWVASSSAPWLTLTTASGTGNGTLAYSFTANSTTGSRSGAITVYGQTLLVTQAGASASLSAASANVGAAAGSGSLNLTVTPAAAWTATSSASWLSVTPSNGSASGALTYVYPANPGTGPRYATLVIAGKSFVLAQAGSGGVYTTWGTNAYGQIRTIAGNGSSGSITDSVPGTASSLASPAATAIDGNRNVYIAETGNNRIRRVDSSSGIITTVAGTGAAGFGGDNGAATSASLSGPTGVAVDGVGNILIADGGNNRIRRVDAVTGVITTVAGTGSAGLSGDGGQAITTTLTQPEAVVVDNSGNFYISEAGSHRVRRVDAATGTILTVAGNGSAGFGGDGGLARNAQLDSPAGLALDAAGNLYIADTLNYRIRRVDSASGTITTLAGNGCCGFVGDGGAASGALIYAPFGVAADASGNVFIADTSNNRIRRVDAVTGFISTVAGTGIAGFTGDNGPALSAGLNAPQGIAADGSGNLIIADTSNGRVRVVDFATPQVSLSPATASVGVNAGTGSAGLSILPAGAVWVATSSAPWLTLNSTSGAGSGTLGYSFTTNNSLGSRVGVITVFGQTLTVTQASATATLSANSASVGPAVGSGSVTLTVTPSAPWTAASNVSWLTVSPTSGTGTQAITWTYTANPGNGGRVATLSIAGMIYTVVQTGTTGAYTEWGQSSFGQIKTIAGTGVSGFSGDGGSGIAAQVGGLGQIALDAAGNLYVADTSNNRIRRVNGATGTINTVAGNGSSGTSGNGGPAVSAQLSAPSAVAVDAAGNLFIADTGNYRVQRVDASTGVVTTVAGNRGAGCCGTIGDGGPAVSAQLGPGGLALDRNGNLYIVDYYDGRIRRVDATTGVITTVAGGGSGGDGGPATSASLTPVSVTLDAAGDIYISDTNNNRVRRVDGVTGIITTVAGGVCCSSGDGGLATSAWLYPGALTLDSLGNLYIADINYNRIRRVDAFTGVITTVAGGGSGGDGSLATSAQLRAALGVAVDSTDDIYIADLYRVRFVDNSSPQVTLAASVAQAGPTAGTDSVAVTISPAGAAWTAVSSASWLTLTSGSGAGNGTLAYGFTANTSTGSRTGAITVYGQTLLVTQAGASASLSASSASAGTAAGSGSLNLTLTPAAAWTATSSASWLSVTPTSGSADGSLTYSYTANAGSVPRYATLIIAGKSFVLTQAGTSGFYTTWGTTAYGQIRTIAGNGSNGGSTDSVPGTSSSLTNPTASAMDGNGNVYIADTGNNRIRRLDTQTGLITTAAGNGVAGFAGDTGAATAASLSGPTGVTVDNAGNLLIADQGNNRIRRVDAVSGVITTVAGTGAAGLSGDGGPAISTILSRPYAVAVDSSGNLYLSETGSNRVRRVDASTGTVLTVAGNGSAGFNGDGGPASSAQLSSPGGLALDAGGNLYLADVGNDRIRRVDSATGTITTFAGNGCCGFLGDGGAASLALIYFPAGVAVDASGNVFIADMSNSRIRRVDAVTGVISTMAGTGIGGFSGDNGPALLANLNGPQGIAVDGMGNLIVTDTLNGRVRLVDFVTPQVSLSATTARVGVNAGTGSVAISISPAGAAWVATSSAPWLTLTSASGTGNGTISYSFAATNTITTRTAFIALFGQTLTVTQTGAAVSLSASSAAASVTAGTGTVQLTVAPSAFWTASSSAAWLTVSPTSGTGNATLTYTYTVNAAANGRMGAVLVGGQTLTVYQAGTSGTLAPWGTTFHGEILTVAGTGTAGFNGDSLPAVAATINTPTSVAVDANGNLYIADTLNNRIRRVDATTGNITTIAGTGIAGFSGDGGLATAARLYYPRRLAFDPGGNLFVADQYNNRIRRIDGLTGNISTVAGGGSLGDGATATSAQLYGPVGVAVDQNDNLYIADTGSNRIRFVNAATGLISTIAGNSTAGFSGDSGPAVSAQLNTPLGIAVDSGGNAFFAEYYNNRIRRVDAGTGIITTFAGNGAAGSAGDGGPAAAAQLMNPWDVAIDGSGNYYIADDGNRRVRRVTGGLISTVAGPGAVPGPLGDGGLASAAQLNFPTGVAVDGAGNLYVAEYLGQRIRFIDLSNPAAAPQTITFGALSNVSLSASPITISATASSGLGVTFASTTASVCTVSGATMTLVGLGNCSITATQPGNATYAAATPVTQSFMVGQASQTVAFGALNNLFLGTGPFTVSATASSGLTVTFNSSTPGVCTVATSTVTILTTGTCSITANQAGNLNYAAAPPVTRSFTISAVASTNTTVSSSVNPSVFGHLVTASATVLPAGSTGKVTFYYGSSVLGTATLAGGRATLATRLLPSGSQRFSAYYFGDAGHAPSTSAAVPQRVNAIAGPGFATAVDYGTGQSPRAFAIADFNNDGKPDMAVANNAGGSLDIFAGNGDGTFQTAVSYETDATPFSVVAGDFNGDGIVDLAIGAQSGNVDVLLGNGDGTFQAAVAYATGTTPTTVIAADFNHDGVVDLAVADSGSNNVVILRGKGDGTFQAGVNYAVGSAPTSLTAGDFNGDGVVDLATANATSNDVSILLGNGDGTFRVAVNYPADSQPSSVATGDFNGDGKADLVIANAAGNSVSVLLGNGDGTFQARVNYGAGTGPQMIATGDLDGDGNADLAVADNSGSSISILLGKGDGTFQSATSYGAGTGPTALAISDFNGDGRPDLVAANYNDNNVSVLLGNPPPTPSLTSVTPNTLPAGSAATAVTVAGSNFVSGDTLVFTPPGGAPVNIPPSLLQAAQIGATLPAPLLSSPGTAQVAVANALGTLSNQMSFTIVAPSVTSVTPNIVPAGSGATAVTVAGLNFTSGATFVFTPPGRAATTITPSLVQAAQVAATIPATLLSSAGTGEIAIANAGGTLSNQMPFIIVAPSVTSANPGTVPAGSGATTITVNGSNFTSGATLVFTPPGQAAATITPSLVQAAQLAATIPATLLSSAGTAAIAIANGTGTLSNQFAFTITVPGTASQTITFTAIPNQTYGAAPFVVQATATSGLSVGLASTTPSACSIAGGLVTILTSGTCTIVASQPGNTSFAAAANVSQSFLIAIPNNAVMLAVGAGTGTTGQTVEIPIQMTATGTASPATFQADLSFDPAKLTFASARIGAQATSAGKTLSSNIVSDGDVRILVAGLNQNAISNGVVGYASFTLNSPFTSGSASVTPLNCSAADGSGNSLVTPCTAGTIRYVTCDINADGNVNVSDVQLIINEALGVAPAVHDLNGDGMVNVADVQIVINAALGLGCVVP